jgi:hypothetical protein
LMMMTMMLSSCCNHLTWLLGFSPHGDDNRLRSPIRRLWSVSSDLFCRVECIVVSGSILFRIDELFDMTSHHITGHWRPAIFACFKRTKTTEIYEIFRWKFAILVNDSNIIRHSAVYDQSISILGRMRSEDVTKYALVNVQTFRTEREMLWKDHLRGRLNRAVDLPSCFFDFFPDSSQVVWRFCSSPRNNESWCAGFLRQCPDATKIWIASFMNDTAKFFATLWFLRAEAFAFLSCGLRK